MAETTNQANETEVNIPHSPGQVITPSTANVPAESINTAAQAPKVIESEPVANADPIPVSQPAAPVNPPDQVSNTVAATQNNQQNEAPAPQQIVAEEPQIGLFHNDQDGPDAEINPLQKIEPVSWTASEFVHHEKNASWYTILGAVSLVVAVTVYLVTKDIVSAVVVLLAAFTLGFYGARKPRQLDYQLDASGLSVGTKHFRFGEFKSFSVSKEGAFSSIILMPLKRFSQVTTLYLAPENENEIIDILSGTLPFEEHKKDVVDKLMHKIRF